MVETNIQPKEGIHPLAQPRGRRLLLKGHGLPDVKLEHGLKEVRTVLAEERKKLDILQDPKRIIAK